MSTAPYSSGHGMGGPIEPPPDPLTTKTPFRYAFPDLVKDAKNLLPTDDPEAVIEQLKALGVEMAKGPDTGLEGNSRIPAGYTYWGQFIDHDVTKSQLSMDVPEGDALNAFDILFQPFEPADPEDVQNTLVNEREPILNLDSVYLKGPDDPDSAGMYEPDGVRMRVGICSPNAPGVAPNPDIDGETITEGLRNDLPRGDGRVPIIGDGRNDENLAVAQFHTAFLRFHNAVVDALEERHGLSGPELFAEARRQVTLHYQWLVVHDYLRTIAGTGALYRGAYDAANFMRAVIGGGFTPAIDDAFMPLEFSVGAFRFGHSMVRPEYDWNRNFGRLEPGDPHTPLSDRGTFPNLFSFTGAGGLKPAGSNFPPSPQLPFNWIARWPRLFFDADAPEFEDRFSRRIDTNIAPPLATMENELQALQSPGGLDERLGDAGRPPTDTAMRALWQHLAQRNLLRGYRLSIPTGQAIAKAMGATPLTEDEILGSSDEMKKVLKSKKADLVNRTPLWFYVLREAEVRQNGSRLGEVGGRIVAGTLVGLLLMDSASFMASGWTPDQGVVKQVTGRFQTIGDFLAFAGVSPSVEALMEV